MADMPSITIVKSMPYRGTPEEWSNTYHFTGGDPATDAEWKAFADAIIALEKAVIRDDQDIIRAVGHKAGVTVHAWAYDYAAHGEEVAGTFSHLAGIPGGGDSAAWIRWSTTQLTSKGKPIYLRSYMHPGIGTSTTDPDTLLAAYKTALQA